jgi:hypothetical protein
VIFDRPIDFDSAIRFLDEKEIRPTDQTSAEIARDRVYFDHRGMFSAQTLSAQLLQEYQNQLVKMGKGEANMAEARLAMKRMIAELEIDAPSEKEAGTITDLGSNSRIGLVLETNLAMARGYGQYRESMDPEVLAAWPAFELVRVGYRKVPREWIVIWDQARISLGNRTTATNAEATGRMVAKKGDPIWLAISDCGQPWPPFKYRSGMGLEDVIYDEAVELGVIAPQQKIAPAKIVSFNSGVSSSTASLGPAMIAALAASLTGIAVEAGGSMVLDDDSSLSNSGRTIRNRCNAVLEFLEVAA